MGRLELALIAVFAASPALAQDEPETPGSAAETEALRLFNEARVAFEERRYADARRGLERSLGLAPRGATAMNLARVLRSVGEPVAAVRVLDAILDGEYGEPTEERRRDAVALRAEASREIALLAIAITGGGASVRIDGERVRIREVSNFEHEVDPGRHVIIATASDGRSAERRVVVEPGGRAVVEMDLGEAPATDDGAPAWPWILLATGLGLAGGAAVLVIVLAGSDPEPVGDPQNVYPIIEALRF